MPRHRYLWILLIATFVLADARPSAAKSSDAPSPKLILKGWA